MTEQEFAALKRDAEAMRDRLATRATQTHGTFSCTYVLGPEGRVGECRQGCGITADEVKACEAIEHALRPKWRKFRRDPLAPLRAAVIALGCEVSTYGANLCAVDVRIPVTHPSPTIEQDLEALLITFGFELDG